MRKHVLDCRRAAPFGLDIYLRSASKKGQQSSQARGLATLGYAGGPNLCASFARFINPPPFPKKRGGGIHKTPINYARGKYYFPSAAQNSSVVLGGYQYRKIPPTLRGVKTKILTIHNPKPIILLIVYRFSHLSY